MKIKLFHALLFACLLSSPVLAQTKVEAESGTLENGGVIANSALASGGKYVQMQAANLTFSVTVESAGLYNLTFVYAQTYGDTKAQNLIVNGANIGLVHFPQTEGAAGSFDNLSSALTSVRLNAGENTIALTNNWGWVDIDYAEIAPYEVEKFNVSATLVTPTPSAGAQKLYSFLRENFQDKIISGVQTGYDLADITELFNQSEVNFVFNSSGKRTAVVGFDFLMGTGQATEAGNTWYKSFNDNSIQLAKELWQKGGIPTFAWHWRDPSLETCSFYTDTKNSEGSNDECVKQPNGVKGTRFSIKDACADANCAAWNTSSDAYKNMVRDIDIIAGYLKELQDAGVAVLWRPIHEASGGWFWWGRDGAVPFKLLYNLLFEKLVNEHNLNNLIWVWNSEGGTDEAWYPGDDKVDIIGRDFYYYNVPTKNHASLIGEFDKIKNAFGTDKMIALSENGANPYPENLVEDGAGWSWFMTWNTGHTGIGSSEHNTAADWNLIMNHDYTITLEDMPGWDNYNKIASKNILSQKTNISVFPTLIRESVNIQCEKGFSIQVVDSRGKVIASAKAAAGLTTLSSLNWAKGVYFISVSGKNTLKTFKVIR